MVTATLSQPRRAPQSWPRWIFDTLLWVLLLGPVISPLFRATGLPLIADAGLLARDLLSVYVCPTPERSYMLLGLPMAVCARCWGATIGLWAARLSVAALEGSAPPLWLRPLRVLRGFDWRLRFILCALPFLLWPLEIIGAGQGWWFAPLWLLLLNGAQAGFAAGLFFCSAWPGMWEPRAKGV
ncbi:DUF2085 domain-containing protein [Candidatus Gracilibacteria bacterium]|nr:DUF2085 domain-containing protein [Candidatus Gracilibacteria bacterium]